MFSQKSMINTNFNFIPGTFCGKCRIHEDENKAMVKRLPAFLVSLTFLGGMLCCAKKVDIHHTTFTKADSVTDIYLSLHDSVLRPWNMMIHDDNQKLKAMRNLLHELQVRSIVSFAGATGTLSGATGFMRIVFAVPVKG